MFMKGKLRVILCCFLTLLQVSLSVAEENQKNDIKIKSIKADNISNDKEGNLLLEGKVLIKTNKLDLFTDKAFF